MTAGGSSSAVACKAVCVLTSESGGNHVLGHLTLTQSDVNSNVIITGTLSGLSPLQKHGLSVCVNGDVSKGAATCGPIFNPFGKTHGAPSDKMRMVGDLGNISADEVGTSTVKIVDTQVRLLGPHSVIGRSLVLYAGEDDQGRGGHENSLTTGNAGPRIAAGVIGISS